jgi:hypothetical protein
MNLESVKTDEGTHDVQALIIGNSITRIDALQSQAFARSFRAIVKRS